MTCLSEREFWIDFFSEIQSFRLFIQIFVGKVVILEILRIPPDYVIKLQVSIKYWQ
jgi:hypothetical protein